MSGDYAEFLKDQLEEAVGCIEFLHGCLTDPERFLYAYPSMTVDTIAQLREIVGERPRCIHSATKPGCEGCELRHEVFRRRAKYANPKETTNHE